MLNVTEPFKQEVIHENEQIYRRISDELRKASTQVLVATAWFTDQDLFHILLDLTERGIDVRVILADNEDNKKLDFEKLRRKGATVYRIKKAGYGGMHKKFCVMDKQTAIHGSYNWTINARINNHESVIVTNHTETVASLIDQFAEMEAEALAALNKEKGWDLKSLFHKRDNKQDDDDSKAALSAQDQQPAPEPLTEDVKPEEKTPEGDKVNFQSAYAEVLNGMIAAEVCNFDRELLRNQGYERAKDSNGDAQILGNAMDTVYSVFINDINVVEDKKKRLIGKINEQKIVYSGVLENNYQTMLRSIEGQTESTRQETIIKISESKTKAGVYETDIDTIKNQKIVAAEKTEKELEDQIKEMEQESIVPKFKWYEFIPVVLFGVGLLSYLFLFYSSAVYILLFSERDAKRAMDEGGHPDIPHVFEPKAFAQILDEGGYAISFVFLFVFIPLAIAVTGRLAKGSLFSKGGVMLSLALLLDAGIAYKVAASIHQAEYNIGIATEQWRFTMAFTETNFYLVFLLGSLGLFIFHALFNKFISLFEERNPEVRALQLTLKKGQEKELLQRHRTYIAMLKDSAEIFGKELIKVKNELHIIELELAGLPHKKAMLQEKASLDYENNKRVLNDVTAVYIARIENDVLPISVDSIKDRINVFLEGWTSFLNDQYAIIKASAKATQALEAAAIWQQQKLAGNQIDNRVKQPL